MQNPRAELVSTVSLSIAVMALMICCGASILSCVLVTTAMQVAAADPGLFKARRTALLEMPDGRVAVLYGAQAQVGGVVEELFVQDSSFYFLTGISEPGAALLLAPGEKQYREILYLQPRDPDVENWNGRREPFR